MVYLNSELAQVDFINAKYVRHMTPKSKDTFQIKDYYLSGELYQEGFVKMIFPYLNRPGGNLNNELKANRNNTNFFDNELHEYRQPIQIGKFTTYYKNGKRKSEGHYLNGLKEGKVTQWYSNGQKEGDYLFSDSLNQVFLDNHKTGTERQIINFFDSLGNQLVKEGNGVYVKYEKGPLLDSGRLHNSIKEGVWKGSFKSGKSSYIEQYENGLLTRGTSIDSEGNSYQYTKLIVAPYYGNYGDNEFYSFVSKNMVYPIEARRRNIQGTVFVQFIVDELGNTTQVKTLKGFYPACDMEAEKAVDLANNFKPALIRGQPVSVLLVIPIELRLRDVPNTIMRKRIN
ncbi:energy transducer TonB [Xanthovirga aplysinae]|uniref:energy transducer TonB n=1 Tax=Xanthovirga aplysinae TaxID=2529853 RepID=UPI0012BBA652|nr:energy transducer TonB [Xanthovirga aplysinae]MTI31011.1 TonB family protein [Xanthovirga aplysinae]